MSLPRHILKNRNGEPDMQDPFDGLKEGDGKIIEKTSHSVKAKIHIGILDKHGNATAEVNVKRDGSYDTIIRKSDGSVIGECNSNNQIPDADGFKKIGDRLLSAAGIKHHKPKLYEKDQLVRSEDGSVIARNAANHGQQHRMRPA